MAKDLSVSLTAYESLCAGEVGCIRQICAMRNGQKENLHVSDERESWSVHIDAAGSELAFCKLHNVLWTATVNIGKAADVGQVLEIRSRSEHWHDLCIRPADNPNFMYVLMTGRIPNFRGRGWTWGYDAMVNKNWMDPNGKGHAWFIKSLKLRSFREPDFLARLPAESYNLSTTASIIGNHVRNLFVLPRPEISTELSTGQL